jgi:hypothetical protein
MRLPQLATHQHVGRNIAGEGGPDAGVLAESGEVLFDALVEALPLKRLADFDLHIGERPAARRKCLRILLELDDNGDPEAGGMTDSVLPAKFFSSSAQIRPLGRTLDIRGVYNKRIHLVATVCRGMLLDRVYRCLSGNLG